MSIIKYLKILRFDWIYFLGIPVLGYIYDLENNHFFSLRLFSILFTSSLYLFHGYLLNDYFDLYRKTAESEIKQFKVYLIICYIILLTNIIFSLLFAKDLILIILFGAILAFAYSAFPFRLKSKPFINTFINCFGFSMLFFIGSPISRKNLFESLLFFIFFMLILTVIQVIHELSHFSKDKINNAITTTVLCKEGFSIFIIILSLVAVLIWTVFMYNRKFCHFLFVATTFLFAISLVSYIIKKHIERELVDNPRVKIVTRVLSLLYGFIAVASFLIK